MDTEGSTERQPTAAASNTTIGATGDTTRSGGIRRHSEYIWPRPPQEWYRIPEFVPRSQPLPTYEDWNSIPEFVPMATQQALAWVDPFAPEFVPRAPSNLALLSSQTMHSQAQYSFPSTSRMTLPSGACVPHHSRTAGHGSNQHSVTYNTPQWRPKVRPDGNPQMLALQTGSLLGMPCRPLGENDTLSVAEAESQLCPYALNGECRYGSGCLLVHGITCDYCGLNVLHPGSSEQQSQHKKSCLDQIENDMEFSFAMAETAEMSCYICYDVIKDKEAPGDQRFGILPGCFHCYCLTCIRSWRQRAREFESRVGRSCPVCRVPSDFVIPSRFWVDNQEDKDRLISSYKAGMKTKRCRYFAGGIGFCPFGDKCFYSHSLDARATTSSTSSDDNGFETSVAHGEGTAPPVGLYRRFYPLFSIEGAINRLMQPYSDSSDDEDW